MEARNLYKGGGGGMRTLPRNIRIRAPEKGKHS